MPISGPFQLSRLYLLTDECETESDHVPKVNQLVGFFKPTGPTRLIANWS